jgi:multisubunit Na+/H+ antiporter MnhB subunit
MAEITYLVIIAVFILYYLVVLIGEKRFIHEPRDIIEKFLAVVLLYAGISLIYFSITGKPFLTESISEYYIYTFIIGFIAVLWAIPNLLSEFNFFKRFSKKTSCKKIKSK